jgi:hypothetical protein
MPTRKELDKEAKQAGVENPEELDNAEQVKEQEALATGRARSYYFPELGVSVIAETQELAEEKARSIAKERGTLNA